MQGTGHADVRLYFIRIPENSMISLQPFNKCDFSQLIAEVPDARFLLQWAGPEYIYPLDSEQLHDTLVNTNGEKPSFQVFKAVRSDRSETVGHIQLMNIDYRTSSCDLGRVLIFQKYRGNGFGKAMVRSAVDVAFTNLQLTEITLGVFDFNRSAIDIYKSVGFEELQIKKAARKFNNEHWNVIMMKLCKIDGSVKSPTSAPALRLERTIRT